VVGSAGHTVGGATATGTWLALTHVTVESSDPPGPSSAMTVKVSESALTRGFGV